VIGLSFTRAVSLPKDASSDSLRTRRDPLVTPGPNGAHLTLPVGDRDHVEGSPEAVVTLLEYAGYECPHSGTAYPVVRDLQDAMGTQMRFVFRNLPIAGIHRHGENAAESAEAAGAQGRFWEMHGLLFKNQQELGKQALLRYAEEVGLNIDRFTREMAGRIFAPRVREDYLSGVQSGVEGTPTFFINSVRHDDSNNTKTLLAAIRIAAAPAPPR
jgi:protein-disulfide isomerase